MTIVYFDCPSGAAGDMLLAALLDAGASMDVVQEALNGLNLSHWSMQQRPVMEHGMRALSVQIDVDEEASERSHRAIVDLLTAAPLAAGVRDRALQAFTELARAEARVHGVPIDDVHFHEVGALDSIIDIVGSCAALESLGPALVVASPLPLGRGSTETRHGTILLPAPATLELLEGMPIVEGGVGETVTPTGAALLRTFCDSFGPIPAMKLTAVGTGAGSQQRAIPNVLRVLVGEPVPESSRPDRTRIETNIDDMSPELLPYVLERLLAAGADDAWTVPITMKKGRTATMLCVLAPKERVTALLSVIYEETTTLGVRLTDVVKDSIERTTLEVLLGTHRIRVKVGTRDGRIVTVAPEYEDCAQTARATGLPLKEIYRQASEVARESQPQA